MSERQLWCAVIQQAWDDYFAEQPNYRGGPSLWAQRKRSASLFLKSPKGKWARSRIDICNAVGIDPDALRESVLKEDKRRAAA